MMLERQLARPVPRVGTSRRQSRRLERLLELPNRDRLYRLVQSRPGIHLRGLERASGLRMSTIVYHMRRLRKAGLLVTRRKDRRVAHFAAGPLDRRDKDYLYYLRGRIPRRIALLVAEFGPLQLMELVRLVGRSRSTVTHHLQRLVNERIVQVVPAGGRKFYRAGNVERVRRLIRVYGRTFSP